LRFIATVTFVTFRLSAPGLIAKLTLVTEVRNWPEAECRRSHQHFRYFGEDPTHRGLALTVAFDPLRTSGADTTCGGTPKLNCEDERPQATLICVGLSASCLSCDKHVEPYQECPYGHQR